MELNRDDHTTRPRRSRPAEPESRSNSNPRASKGLRDWLSSRSAQPEGGVRFASTSGVAVRCPFVWFDPGERGRPT